MDGKYDWYCLNETVFPVKISINLVAYLAYLVRARFKTTLNNLYMIIILNF